MKLGGWCKCWNGADGRVVQAKTVESGSILLGMEQVELGTA